MSVMVWEALWGAQHTLAYVVWAAGGAARVALNMGTASWGCPQLLCSVTEHQALLLTCLQPAGLQGRSLRPYPWRMMSTGWRPVWEVCDIQANFEKPLLHLCPCHLYPFPIIPRACEHRKKPGYWPWGTICTCTCLPEWKVESCHFAVWWPSC